MGTEVRPQMRQQLGDLVDSVWALATLLSGAEIGLLNALGSARTAQEFAAGTGITVNLGTAMLDVLVSLGIALRDGDVYSAAPGVQGFLQGSEAADVRAWVLSTCLQSSEMVAAARRGQLRPGWTHTDPAILEAQGRTGREATRVLATRVFPGLPGLEQRLRATDATFLDAGMGVGIISIEMCRIYPSLRVVGLEPGAVQAAEARRNIAGAGFEDRIEVRMQSIEDLSQPEAFDLAYIAQVFMPLEVVRTGLSRVREALRPGGWVVMPAMSIPGDDLHAATTRLVNVMWGGASLSAEALASMTRAAGFEHVQVGNKPGGPVRGVLGRRPL